MSQRILAITLAAIALVIVFRYFYPSPKAEDVKIKAEDVEIDVKEEKLSPGSLRFEGTIMNTGAADISKLVVAADISELSFKDAELNGCLLESRIAEIRNLKAGETRPVIWHFSHSPNQLKCGREVHNGESFDYTVNWNHYRWKLSVVEIE